MLVRPGLALGQRLLRAEVVSGREVLAARGQDHHAHLVVGLGAAEGLVQLHQQGARLGVLGSGRLSQMRAIRPSSRVS